MSRHGIRKSEGRERSRGAWIVVAIVVVLVCVGMVWWKGDRQPGPVPPGGGRSSRDVADAGGAACLPGSTKPAPAEQERALRSEQLKTVEQLVAAFPQSDDAVYLLGLVYNEQGDTAAAQAQLPAKCPPGRGLPGMGLADAGIFEVRRGGARPGYMRVAKPPDSQTLDGFHCHVEENLCEAA